jgi:hypothetical protein
MTGERIMPKKRKPHGERKGVTTVTEAEWLGCTDPTPMLEFLRRKVSDRKLRLFLCACSRQTGHLLTDQRSWQAVEVAERYVDGLASPEELAAAHTAACEAALMIGERLRAELDAAPASLHERLRRGTSDDPAVATAYRKLDAASAAWEVAHTACEEIKDEWTATRSRRADSVVQCQLLRDIFFLLPFHPATVAPSWLAWNDRTLPKLAEAIYQERAFDHLPILGDALKEAGCREPVILNHCRGPGPHVRGCWAVDLILGKE